MTLTDQDFWHILQIAPPVSNPSRWEQNVTPVPGQAWFEWAKTEVLSMEAASPSRVQQPHAIVYLARLVRVLDVLAECGIDQDKMRRENGIAMYAEAYLKELLNDGLAACDCSANNVEYTLLRARHDGLLTEHKCDDWHGGMKFGTGKRTYYALSYTGKKQAEKASVMPPVWDEQYEEMQNTDLATGEVVGSDESAVPSCGAEGSKNGNGWADLAIGKLFEPQVMMWNGHPFSIEEPASCYLGFDLENHALEDYFPELLDNWNAHIKDVSLVELKNLRILRLVGLEKTLLIHVMLMKSQVVYPERLESSGDTDGWHEGGVVVVEGQSFAAKGIHVEPTEPKTRAKIEAAHRARRPVAANTAVAVSSATAAVKAGKQASRVGEKDVATRTDDSILDAIRKHTDLIPKILEKVDGTPFSTAALLKGSIRQKLGTLGTVSEDGFSASAHFTNIAWGGKQYVIRQTAAVIVETLFIGQKTFGLPGMHQEEVFAQVYTTDKKKWPSGKTRIQNFFRNGDAKRLWDDGLIGHDGKGNFHLNIKIHT